MTNALAGKVVLVTGASKGIGAGIATAFGAAAIRKAPSASRPRLEQRAGGRSPFRATWPKPQTSKPWSPRQWRPGRSPWSTTPPVLPSDIDEALPLHLQLMRLASDDDRAAANSTPRAEA